ncbi:MAG TPA: ABC transporter permease [Dehalococcoidia bacterium]|nr:ABC transporter permease [Dehalococcoidia bacterium]
MAVESQRLDAVLEPARTGRSAIRRAGTIAAQNPLGVLGLGVIILFMFVGFSAPWLAPYGANEFAGEATENPSWDHPFGTDTFGRDMLSRIIYGARISLAIGVLAVVSGTVTGTLIGMFSAHMGGWVDNAIQRTVDTVIAFPGLILLIIIIGVLGPSIRNVVIVIAIGIIPGIARVVRGACLSEKQNQYIEAAHTVGASGWRIVFVHLLPNILALSIVIMTSLLAAAILAEASLAFLGLGVPAATNPSWGADINAARNNFPIHLWWAFFPGVAISLTVLAFNLLGDALRDIFDPRLRGSR